MCDQEDQGANVPDDELLVEEPTCEYTLTLKTTYGCPTSWFVCAIKNFLPIKKKRFACELRVRVCPLVASGDPGHKGINVHPSGIWGLYESVCGSLSDAFPKRKKNILKNVRGSSRSMYVARKEVSLACISVLW